MSINHDFRAASGLNRCPTAEDLADADSPAPPRGPGLFEVASADGQSFLTNVRRIAGRDRERGWWWIASATAVLSLLMLGLMFVSFQAQYLYIFSVKHVSVASAIEAGMLDAGMVILSALGIGLALAGKPSKAERFLIMACAAASAYMNYLAADAASARSVVAYTAAPVFLAVVTDRVISVIRRHVLPGDSESAWRSLGRFLVACARLAGIVALYSLRAVLAPRETTGGLRRMVLAAAPVPAALPRPALPAGEVAAIEPPEVTEPPELAGASKKARLAWWYKQDPGYGNRAAVAAAAKRLAPKADLSEGTARAYLGQICADLKQNGSAA
jgi:hypothetical protein